jgi:phage shock protein PspC (stress-responsive transcriptional regulator)
MKRLYRSRKEKVLAGILGGIAEYFEADPVLIRLIFIALLIFSGVIPAVIVYIIGYFIVPLASDIEVVPEDANTQ